MERLLNAREAAELLGISDTTIYRLTAKRQIPFCKIGGRNVFRPAELERWVKDHEQST